MLNQKKVQLLVFLFAASLFSQFSVPPSVTVANGKVKIDFAVSNSIDVEVGIIDVNGKVVKHIAAGVLGGVNPPPTPLANSLTQSLEWDGLDDYGKYITTGPLQVRVRIGVSPKFEKRIHYMDPAYIPPASFAVWNYTGSNNVGWGPDSSIDTTELITPQSPVVLTGHYARNATTGCNLWDGGVTNLDLTVSKETDDILLQKSRDVATSTRTFLLLNGITGVKKKIWTYNKVNFSEPVIDWFGRFFMSDRGYSPCSPDLKRFTLEGADLNFSWGTNVIDMPTYTNDGVRQQGFCNDQYGNIYQAHYPKDTSDKYNITVSKWDSVGNAINENLLKINCNVQGVRVDISGNIFVACKLKPITDTVPKSVRPLLQGGWNDRAPFSQAAIADEAYGSIVKFGPEGGTISNDAAGAYYKQSFILNKPYTAVGNRLSLNGVKWTHFGSSFVFSKSPTNNFNVCGCYNPRFDVDRFGRVIFPDPMSNSFKALDNNGNELFRVHNRDLFKDVRMGTVVQIQATDKRIYLGDNINNQIVALSWKADAETLIALPAGTSSEKRLPASLNPCLGSAPNPFTSSTVISVGNLDASTATSAKLYIVNPIGQIVADMSRDVRNGKRSIEWNGKNTLGEKLPSGVYYMRLTIGRISVQKMLMVTR
ncbi:MAG: hypothetical protein JNL74_22570 [Fibrobacteres bacterium]|nr:hypothetical protein [Fibrobacterota bacterium]